MTTNLKHICHSYFKYLARLGLLGNSVVKAAKNSIEKCGVDILISMTIDNPGLT